MSPAEPREVGALSISRAGELTTLTLGPRFVVLDPEAAWQAGMALLKKSCQAQGLTGPLVVIKPEEKT